MFAVLATVNFNSGHYQEAATLSAAALALERKLAPQSLRVASNLARLGDALREESKLDAAESNIRDALEIYRRLTGDASLEVAATLHSLSDVLVDAGDYAAAQGAAEQALALQERLGAKGTVIADSIHAIGSAQAARGDYDDAEEGFRRAHELGRKIRGDLHPDTLNALGDLANALRKQAQLNEAETLYREALAKREKVCGGDHADIAQTSTTSAS